MRIQYIQHIEEREEYWKAIEKDLQDEKFKLGCQILLLEQ